MSNQAPNEVVVLVIEDDLPMQNVLSDALTESGYRVITTTLGGEGLMRIGIAEPQLVTLDLRLPDVRGEVVLEKLRNYRGTRTLPVVVISGDNAIPPEVRDMADAIVPKPFDLNVLLEIIQKLVPPGTPDGDGATLE